MACLQFDVKKQLENVTLNFWDFFRQSVKKLREKQLFERFCVSTFFPLLAMLRNNEKNLHQSMFCVRNIMLRERGILKLLFKILIIFCHWFSEICKKKRKMRFYSCCFKNLKCALMGLRYTLSSILRQQTMPKKPKKCHNIIFQLLLSGTCSKRVFTRTQWRMILFG